MEILFLVTISIILLIAIGYGFRYDRMCIKVVSLLSSDEAKEKKEITEIYALNGSSVNNFSGSFLFGYLSEYGFKYKYLIKTEDGYQLKTISNGNDVFIKEVEGNTGRKIIIYNSVEYLKETTLKKQYNIIGEDAFKNLANKYSKTIFEVPKGTIKLFYDIDVSK